MYLYGANGHGKVIREIVESLGRAVNGFVDDGHDVNELSGLPVKHTMEGVDEVVVCIDDNKTRKEVAERLGCKFADAVVQGKAIVSPTARIGEGSVVMAGAIVNPDAQIGRHCIIDMAAFVDYDCVIGDFVHVAPNVSLCGKVQVGEGTLIGVGASVTPGVKIGKWCTIGAGAAVTEDIPDYSTAVGVPAKVISQKKETI